MALLERDQVKSPVLRKQTVPVPALGGDVIVRGLLLSELLEKKHVNASAKLPQEGETEERARARAGGQVVAFTLARAVTLGDDKPLYTEAEWEVFGAAHPGEVLDLFSVSESLNGRNKKEVAKN
jgi:hypothetical protein